MPIKKRYLKIFKSMQNQYCTTKYGKAGIKDKTVQGISSCPKGRQVFYATMKARKIPYALSDKELLSLAELLDLAVEGILLAEEE